MSGSSLPTLGFVGPPDLATNILAFVEAILGLSVLALLISYLPTIYGRSRDARSSSRSCRATPSRRPVCRS